MRPYQWVKNFLVLPLFFLAFQFDFDKYNLTYILITFLSFSLFSSSVYALNDAIDSGDDKKNNFKRNRPIASGKLTKKDGYLLSVLLLIIGSFFSISLNLHLFNLLIIYFTLNLFYSLFLKKIFFLDCILLSFFYLARIISPATLAEININYWLISFSFFIFLSLATLKKIIDFDTKYYINVKKNINIKFVLYATGAISLSISLAILVSYFNSSDFYNKYNSIYLYLLIPLFMYWNINLWIQVIEEKVNYDPIIFALKNPISLFLVFLSALLFIVSYYAK